jgi:hypothetical protein
MAKIGDKRHYPRRLIDINKEENAEKEMEEGVLIDQENESISKRQSNQRIPIGNQDFF